MTAPGAGVSRETPLGIYLHIPFCQARCSYCAFYTVPDRVEDRSRFIHALEAEIDSVAHRGRVAPGLVSPAPAGRRVDTVYLGGGTPSLLTGSEVARLLRSLAGCFSMTPGAEVTLEANPETVRPGAAESWMEAGVSRVSLGAQTFRDSTLTGLGRLHDAAAIRSAVARLRQAGCDNLSLDLIAGVDTHGFDADLEEACDLEPEHLSVYLLEMEEAEVGGLTPLARRASAGHWCGPGEDWYDLQLRPARPGLPPQSQVLAQPGGPRLRAVGTLPDGGPALLRYGRPRWLSSRAGRGWAATDGAG